MAKKTTLPFTVQSKIREFAKGKGLRVSGEFGDALNEKVEGLIEDAARRAGDNKRSTLKPGDL